MLAEQVWTGLAARRSRWAITALLGPGGALLVLLAFAPPAFAGRQMNGVPAAERISLGTALADVPPASAPRWGPTASPTPTAVSRGLFTATPGPGSGVQVLQTPDAR